MRILVVEDDTAIADYLEMLCSLEGLDVEVRRNNYDGLISEHRWSRYDAVVVDLMLPGVTGLSLLAAARTSIPAPRLVCLSAGPLELRARAVEYADVVLTKPCPPQDILDALVGFAT